MRCPTIYSPEVVTRENVSGGSKVMWKGEKNMVMKRFGTAKCRKRGMYLSVLSGEKVIGLCMCVITLIGWEKFSISSFPSKSM